MTGQELLEILQALPPEHLSREVSTEGCDCYGDVKRVSVEYSTIDLLRS